MTTILQILASPRPQSWSRQVADDHIVRIRRTFRSTPEGKPAYYATGR